MYWIKISKILFH